MCAPDRTFISEALRECSKQMIAVAAAMPANTIQKPSPIRTFGYYALNIGVGTDLSVFRFLRTVLAPQLVSIPGEARQVG
jgi:hypothetical protein